MSENRHDVSHNPHSEYRRQAARHFTGTPTPAAPAPAARFDLARDVSAGFLLLVALLLPWNVYFGVGVPNSSGWLFGLVIVATLLSWGSLALSYAGRRGMLAGRLADPDDVARVRLGLNAPYLLLVFCSVAFTVVQAVRYGGTGDVPPGVGPGVLVGVAGALLSAQPVITDASNDDDRVRTWFRAPRIIGIAAMVLATLSVLFNLYWRTRFVLPNIGDAEYGSQNIAVVATALVYGAVALIGVLVGLRWLLQEQVSALLAAIALGASTLVASVVVWSIGWGRDIDAFHGIGQNTSTAAVGFEGYLAWAAAAAIVGPLILLQAWSAKPLDKSAWWGATRKCLLLIAVWCSGSAVLRIFDLIVAASLELPYSPYDSMALLAFDVVAAVIAVWVGINLTNASLHPAVTSALCGVLFVLTVCRVVVGVGLAPRILYITPPEGLDTAVYGNTLDHQITSTFDVVLCGLALAVTAVAVIIGQLGGLRKRRAVATAAAAPPADTSAVWAGPADANQQWAPRIAPQGQDSTQRIGAHAAPEDPTQQLSTATEQLSVGGGATQKVTTGTPRISRGTGNATQQFASAASEGDATQEFSTGAPKIARLLQESTQRFAAGTTYTGSGRPESSTGEDDNAGN